MARFDYDYDYDDAPKWPKRLRIAAIFVVIAAVTAGIIYLSLPKKDDNLPPEPTESPAATAEDKSVEGEVDRAASALPDPEAGTQVADKPVPETGKPAGSDAAESAGKPADAEPAPDKEKSSGAASSSASVTAEPEKGVPWAGDPPEELDKPKIVPAPPLEEEKQKLHQEAVRKLEAREFPAAAQLAAGVLASVPSGSESGRAAADTLTAADWGICESRIVTDGVTLMHPVRAGDSLSRLAAKYHTTVEALRQLNRVKGDNIMVGQKLFVVPGPWRIEVRKGERRLYLHQESSDGKSRLFMVFDVGIGRLGKTPTASFVISARLRHPDWYAPDGAIYKYGEKENILGDYYLKLGSAGTGKPLRGFGIHGTPDGAGVTRSLSSGCIRMRNADVEKIYLLAPNQTPVNFVD